AHRPTLLVDLTEEAYDRVMAVNAKAVFLALRYAARHMRDGGRIINISTLNTVLPSAGLTAYAGSKGAVEQFTAVAARELGGRGITVNTVSPGATDTDLLRSSNTPEGLERVARMTPLGRLGTPADVADVVAFLASPDSRWITGQSRAASGGRSPGVPTRPGSRPPRVTASPGPRRPGSTGRAPGAPGAADGEPGRQRIAPPAPAVTGGSDRRVH